MSVSRGIAVALLVLGFGACRVVRRPAPAEPPRAVAASEEAPPQLQPIEPTASDAQPEASALVTPPEPEPPRQQPQPTTTPRPPIDVLAPPLTTFHLLLTTKKLRRSPFAQQILDIIAPLPDFERLMDAGRIDPLHDLDHIIIASPDVRDWTQTFLAMSHRLSREEMQAALERAAAADDQVIEWVHDGGLLRGNPRPSNPERHDVDTRWFAFIDGKVVVYVREELLPNIVAGPADEELGTIGDFVARHSRPRRVAASRPDAGMRVALDGLRGSIKGPVMAGGKPLPFAIPKRFELSISAATNPKVVVRLELEDVVEAKAFLEWWNEDLAALIDGNFTIKLQMGWFYELLQPEREGTTVTLRGQLTTDQALMTMQLAADGARKIAKKTPEEIAEMRQRRIDAWKARRGGKLPPSALDPKATGGASGGASGGATGEPGADPAAPPAQPPPEPAKTPGDDSTNGRAPG